MYFAKYHMLQGHLCCPKGQDCTLFLARKTSDCLAVTDLRCTLQLVDRPTSEVSVVTHPQHGIHSLHALHRQLHSGLSSGDSSGCPVVDSLIPTCLADSFPWQPTSESPPCLRLTRVTSRTFYLHMLCVCVYSCVTDTWAVCVATGCGERCSHANRCPQICSKLRALGIFWATRTS